jgi:hypothetical protein
MRKTFLIPAFMAVIGALAGYGSARTQNSTGRFETAKRVVDLLAAEDFCGVSEKFESSLKQTLTTEKMQEGWAAMIAQAGPFKKQISTESAKSPDGYDMVLVQCEFEKSAGLVRVIFNPQNKIVGLWLAPASNTTTSSSPSD